MSETSIGSKALKKHEKK